MDDDEDEFKLFQKFYKMKRREEWEVQFATKKFKKDFTKSTPTPSPKGGKITSVRKDLTKSTSYPSPDGEKIHPLVKRTPVRKNLTESTSSPSPNGEKMKSVRKGFTKSTSSPPPNGGKVGGSIKPATLRANSQQKGKNVVVSVEEATEGPILADVPPETSRRPFAVVRKWYNDELAKHDKEAWDKFNGCFRAIQSSNTKAANYWLWLSRLEKSHTSLKQENSILGEKLQEAHQLVSRLVSFSSTSRSDMLNAKEKDLFPETSSEEDGRNLKSMFSQLQTADLVNLRIEDFLELVKTLGVQADGVKELESKAMVQEMTSLYQQHLIDGNRLLAFFQQLEDAKK